MIATKMKSFKNMKFSIHLGVKYRRGTDPALYQVIEHWFNSKTVTVLNSNFQKRNLKGLALVLYFLEEPVSFSTSLTIRH